MMADRPYLLDTSLGSLGVVLSEPEGPPRSAVLLLHGLGTRSGINRIWTRTARGLAARGIAALRLDYPGHGDSLSVDGDLGARTEAAARALSWLRHRTGNVPICLMGNCGGAHVAIRLAAQRPLAGVALVTPYLRRPPPTTPAARWLWGWYLRLRRRAAPTKRGRASLDPRLRRDLRRVWSATPTMVLVGEGDVWAADARLLRHLGTRVEVQVAPGVVLRGKNTRQAQDETLTRLVSWLDQRAPALRPA
jgi:alpha-beta hydrolase superfamily lysophospholipase